jgi:hypothetical protein
VLSRFPDAESKYAVLLKNPPSKVTPIVGALVVVQAKISKVMTVLWFGVVVVTPLRTTEDIANSMVGKVLLHRKNGASGRALIEPSN